MSGFISAVKNFAEAVGEGNIKQMQIANQEWFYIYDETSRLIALCIADQLDSGEKIKERFLVPVMQQFKTNYSDILENKIIDISKFSNFSEFVDNQKEKYDEEAGEEIEILPIEQALSIESSIEEFGIDNITLILRHVANHRLVLLGDEILIKKTAALVQNLIRARITSEINENTDLFLASSYQDIPNFDNNIKISTFNMRNKGWTDLLFKTANYEKNLINEVLKKQKKLGDSDPLIPILLFKNQYSNLIEITQEYIKVFWQFSNRKNLEKQLQKLEKDGDKREFLHGNIKKHIQLDIDKLIKETKIKLG
ncbi:MAG: hypothetical protein ACTSWY_08435 [Promethearchaeota archaeon]